MGSNFKFTLSVISVFIVQGFMIFFLSYSYITFSLSLISFPSIKRAFSVMPVPSVHFAPRLKPIVCPSTMPDAFAQFHATL